MSLIICPECGHEVSTTAAACPNCGRPFTRPVIERNVVIADVADNDGGFPKWAFIPIGLLGVILLFILFVTLNRSSDETANRTISVNVGERETAIEKTPARTVSVPPATETQTVTVPQPAATTTTITTAPPSSAPPTTIVNVPADKGSVKIEAKIMTGSGSLQTVKNEKFYLLDKDVQSILSDAGLEPVEGQSLINSFGLSVLYPNRYGEFNRQSLSAIKNHIKYSGLTDGSGTAQMKSVEPDNYYLFGITKSGSGFAVWNSPVSVVNGQNILNLSPPTLTEMN